MMPTLNDLEGRLGSFLELRDSEIIRNYGEYRTLIATISEIPEVRKQLASLFVVPPLFPDRQTGMDVHHALYKALGKTYSPEDLHQDPPWTKKKSNLWTEATITEFEMKEDQSCRFDYEYLDPHGKKHSGTIECSGTCDASATAWPFHLSEVVERFRPGTKLPCLFNEKEPSRHRIFRP